jgi:hypothetical protein
VDKLIIVGIPAVAAAAAIGYVVGRLPLLRPHKGRHHYWSTGCLHGDEVLEDGRTGHEYCQGETGALGTKTPAVCKHCKAPCACWCHQPWHTWGTGFFDRLAQVFRRWYICFRKPTLKEEEKECPKS